MDDQNPFSAPAELGMIQVPGPPREPSPTASINQRQFAMLVDHIVIITCFVATLWLLLTLNTGLGGWNGLLALGATLIFAFAYYYFTEARTGKTPGKYLTRITVISREGKKPTRHQFIGRIFARLIPIDTFSSAELRDHVIYYRDSISGTVVVADKRWKGKCPWLGE